MNDNHEVARRGIKAGMILEDPLLKEALECLTENHCHAWINSEPGNREEREQLYFSVRAIDKLRAYLRGVAADGAIAEWHASLQRAARDKLP